MSVAPTAQRWKLTLEECSNSLALGDQHLEIAHGLALNQGMEQMHSVEVVIFENTAVRDVLDSNLAF